MTWQPMESAPRDGTLIIVCCETPEETIFNHTYPMERTYHFVRYKAAPLTNSRYGAFVWRQENGDTLADNWPVAWKPFEEFDGW